MAPGLSEDDMPMDGNEYLEDPDTQTKIINEEYKTWKKNSPFLYDMILSTALEWPTLTTQWLPDVTDVPGKKYAVHRLLIGTHTSNDAPNYLQIAHVELPKSISPNERDYDEERGEIGGYGTSSGEAPAIKMTITQRINHPGEVNKARYQPQNPNVIATMCIDGKVLIFDRSKHSLVPDGVVRPQVELIGHKSEGFGLSWNPHEQGKLATGSEDMTVRLWDLNMLQEGQTHLKPARTYRHHSAVVNDVQYHQLHRSLIGTVSDDITLQILDVRQDATDRSALSTKDHHTDAINALAFNEASDFVLATASSDKTIGVWDLRDLRQPLHVLEGHTDQVTSLAWHPTEEAVLGSGGYDRRVIFWDLSRVGEEQLPDDTEDGAPELLFMHGGHTNHLADFSWNLNEPWVVCSAAEDNLIQIWKVAEAIVAKDDTDDIPMGELEH